MRRLTIFLIAIGLSGCTGEWGGEGTAPGTIGTGTGDSGGAGGDLSDTLVELANALNRERTDRGLTAVTLRQDLNCAADRHSKDIGAAGICGHTGTDGSSPTERVEGCGGTGWSGEIVACGQRSPEEAVLGWLNSPGHREIMLTPDQKEFGVAMHQNYWTAIFDR